MEMQNDPQLWSGCISGALTEKTFVGAFADAGFRDVQMLSRDEKPWQVVNGIEFRSVTVQACKSKKVADFNVEQTTKQLQGQIRHPAPDTSTCCNSDTGACC